MSWLRADRLSTCTIRFLLIAGLVSAPALAQQRVPRSCVGGDAPESEVSIAGAEEPGERLVVSGVVRAADGRPLGGRKIQVFHTDAEGYYSRGSMDETNPRLCGLMLSGADGRYRFETIRPADYATGGAVAHIHFAVWVEGAAAQRFTLRFAGEPRAASDAPTAAADAAAGERASSRRPLVRDPSGTLHAVYDPRLRD